MAGKFIRTSNMKQVMPDLLADNVKSILNNPYYLFNNLSGSTCTYYNINTTMTTLDEATRTNYSELAATSPIRYNKINNFLLYGIDKIEPGLEFTDFGLEGSDIQGDAIVLPKTIIPYPGDFFTLTQLNNEAYLFKITAVNPNTLDTGATMYRVNYSLAYTDHMVDINAQVVKEFNFSATNYGSNFGCLIESTTASQASEMEAYAITLKDYFIQLFYDNKIQSFSYLRDGCLKCYDPYMIEFMIRNNILGGSTEYIYVTQQIVLPSTFGIDYDRTFFSCLETKDPTKHYCKTAGNLLKCTQKLSLLYAYKQDYYCMEYNHINNKLYMVDIFNDPQFMDKIRKNEETGNVLKDIIIRYFNDTPIDSNLLSKIKHIDFMENGELYYLIPLVIYCIEKNISNMLSKAQ